MTLEEFRRLSNAWGGDVEKWPEAARPAARQVAHHPEAAAILGSARALDALVARHPLVTRARPAGGARGYDLHRGHQHRWAQRGARWYRPAWLLPAASIACSATIGVALALLVTAVDEDLMVLSMIIDSGSMAAGWTLQ